ncbi:MAG TPA: hypothetical protein VFM29_05250 [Vicinamibacteria bacterium]|nr:hypothetical protein [Vicinamibacteria bacterium]
MRRILGRSAALAALLLLVSTSVAEAQGKGRGLGRGKNKGTATASPTNPGGGDDPAAEAGLDIPGSGVRQFGAWLDDASIQERGRGWVGVSVGYWRSTYGHQWDAPSLDAGVGVHPRVQLALSAPVSRISFDDGTGSRGLGDVYLTTKVGLVDPDVPGRNWGLAVAPVLEVLNSRSVVEGQERVYWALPLTFERRFEGFRAYGSAGYFSRGAVFGSGALEIPVSHRVTTLVAMTHSRSREEDPLSDALELSPTRTDISAGAMYAVTDAATVYATLGRTISRLDENGTSLAATAGVSFGFERWFQNR